MITKRDLMLLRGLIMLQSLRQTHCKRDASRSLGMSIDTFNKYAQYIEDKTKEKLIIVDDKGSHLTFQGAALAGVADRIEEHLRSVTDHKAETLQIEEEQIDKQIANCRNQMNLCSMKLDFEGAMLFRNHMDELQKLKSGYENSKK